MVSKAATSKQVIEKTIEEPKKVARKDSAANPSAPTKVAQRGKGIVIAIDAGHGGNDPGAHGRMYEEKGLPLPLPRNLQH